MPVYLRQHSELPCCVLNLLLSYLANRTHAFCHFRFICLWETWLKNPVVIVIECVFSRAVTKKSQERVRFEKLPSFMWVEVIWVICVGGHGHWFSCVTPSLYPHIVPTLRHIPLLQIVTGRLSQLEGLVAAVDHEYYYACYSANHWIICLVWFINRNTERGCNGTRKKMRWERERESGREGQARKNGGFFFFWSPRVSFTDCWLN